MSEAGPNPPAIENTVPCHGIIGHPSKVKFLAIRHTGGWAPPKVFVPPGPVDQFVALINDGMVNKYGLRTRVVRPVVSVSGYHCLEMELVGKASARTLEAVWVGRDEYAKFRTSASGEFDPFQHWLDDRAREDTPKLRAPWHHPGWFDSASTWIRHQLDRLQIQETGSVEQFRVGSNLSCLLRVPTNQGVVFFKAGYARPPLEAELAPALAQVWPERVVEPLAADPERNWLLHGDLLADAQTPDDSARFSPFARSMAVIQVESRQFLDRWKAMGCPVHGTEYLTEFIDDTVRLQPCMQAGRSPLSDDEQDDFFHTLQAQRGMIERLAGFAVPDTLVHTNFRPENCIRTAQGHAFIDWTDAVIAHPFMVLEHIFEYRELSRNVVRLPAHVMELSRGQLADILDAYQEPFVEEVPADRLRAALVAARALRPLWSLTRGVEMLDWTEPDSPVWRRSILRLQRAARQMIESGPRPSPAT